MAHQRFIFQGSECRCHLKEDVKVDDDLGKLAIWKPNIKLDTGSEWATCIYSHFLVHSQNLVLRFRKKNSSTHKLAINKYFFLGFSVFQVVACKGWWCGCRLLIVCLHTRKSLQPQHKRQSLNLKMGFLEVFFLTQEITGEPKLYVKSKKNNFRKIYVNFR